MLSHVLRKLSLVRGWIAPAGRTMTQHVGRFVWHVTPSGHDLFGDAGPDLDGWVRDGVATVVKHGTQRTVFKVRLPAGAAYVKRCRVNGLRAWGREMLRPAKARLEFENAVMLRTLGLPAVEPLAWGALPRRGPGESVIITRCEGGAEPLQKYLDEVFPTLAAAEACRYRRSLARELGILLARLHDAGVAHPDPHPGNLLVNMQQGRPRFILIDLHAIRFGQPLPWKESLQNLVLFNRWFQLRASRSDRQRFWHAYTTHRTSLPTACPLALARMAVHVEQRTWRSNAKFWLGRFARYRKCNRHVHCIAVHRVTGYAVRELSPKLVERFAADPAALARDPSARVIKESPSSTVLELLLPTHDGPRPVIYKHYKVKSPLTLLKNLFRPTPALRSWLYGHNLLDRRLPTAKPLCVLERRRGGVRAEGWMLAEKIPDALPLLDAVRQQQATASPGWEREWAESIGRFLRHLHEKNVAHRDLKASNILMQVPADGSPARPVLIDLVGVTVSRTPIPDAVRIRDLSRLTVSFLVDGCSSRTDRLRVLRAYHAWGLHGQGDWKSWWRAIDTAVRAKVERNRRAGRILA